MEYIIFCNLQFKFRCSIQLRGTFNSITPNNSKMKITGLMITTFLLFSELIHSQPDFRPGYIISRESDTLTGLIKAQRR